MRLLPLTCSCSCHLLLLQLLCGHIMDGVLLLGSSCGRCHMINLQTGRSVSAAAAAAAQNATGLLGAGGSSSSGSSGDHDGPVTCISGNSYLQHFVTCSRDGYVKVSSWPAVQLLCTLASMCHALTSNASCLCAEV
jgi:WD40 repeat protein